MESNSNQTTVGKYLLKRLEEFNVKHIFGIPGDYSLGFCDEIVASPIKWIGTCNELNAGYAADGYARCNGMGVAAVTYGVGALSIINAVAGAYAEQVPLVLISGAPHTARKKSNALVHHLISDYNLQLDVFKKVTIDAAILANPIIAPDNIDRILTNCYSYKLPVYIEIPVDMVDMPCRMPEPFNFKIDWKSDPNILKECIKETAGMINNAKNPVIIAGVEVLRFGQSKNALNLVERTEIPFATTLSSKASLPELHPQFIGVYQGSMSKPHIKEQIENSDCVISLGVKMTDFDTGAFTTQIDEKNVIDISLNQVKINGHYYNTVQIGDVISGLLEAINPREFMVSRPSEPFMVKSKFEPVPETNMTVKRFLDKINSFLNDDIVLVCDTGDAVCYAPAFHIEEADNFFAQPYYLSIGYSVPAALGIALARPNQRPLIVAGDGAFQVTAQEISTLMRNNIHPIVFLMNNEGYTIERLLHTDNIYNDIQNWKYSKLPYIFGDNCLGIEVFTESDLEDAVEKALNTKDKLVFIEIHLDPLDGSDALKELAKHLGKVK
jgi:indolepyruvate decarboxylase